MTYPENCIRGINSPQYVVSGMVAVGAFSFSANDRSDGREECSINWEDEDGVVEFTLNQVNTDGSQQFTAGVYVFPLAEVKRLQIYLPIREVLSYEREVLDENKYHGNILLTQDTASPIRRMIAANLALAAGGQLYQQSINP